MMTLKETLQDISVLRFYSICGYKYRTLNHFDHNNLPYDELPDRMKEGILVMIRALYRTQKMVYAYDIEYVTHCISDCGIKLIPFFKSCGLPKSFARTRSLSKDMNERLMKIRMQLIIMINRLLEYVLK